MQYGGREKGQSEHVDQHNGHQEGYDNPGKEWIDRWRPLMENRRTEGKKCAE